MTKYQVPERKCLKLRAMKPRGRLPGETRKTMRKRRSRPNRDSLQMEPKEVALKVGEGSKFIAFGLLIVPMYK